MHDAAPNATTQENLPQVAKYAKELAGRTGAVIAITGAIDLVADASKALAIRNGHPMMSKITGTGCMLSAITAAFVAANPGKALEATASAVCAMGLCGELAYQKVKAQGAGTGTLRVALIDAMSNLTGEQLEGGAKIEGC